MNPANEKTRDSGLHAAGSHWNECDHQLLLDASEYAWDYLREITERRVGVTSKAIDYLAALGGPLSEKGADPAVVLRFLTEAGSPATIATAGGRFFGGVIGGALPITVAAAWLASAWDQNACLYDFSPVSAFLEDIVLGWLVDLFGLPPGCGGAFVTGTQMADVTALASALCNVLHKIGWDVAADGLFGAPPVTVIAGEEVHATMIKALRLLGIGRRQIVFVPADSEGRMKPEDIPMVPSPAIICAQVGNVNSGACDPLPAICDAARQMDAWVHVDGAFGLWATVSDARRHLVAGLAEADSWATDAHKWLNVPHDSGVAIVKDREALERAMSITAAYYPDPAARREPMQSGPESSRRARAIEIWAALRSLGKSGVAEQIERTCRHAAKFAEALRGAGYEVLNEVVLNQVLVAFGSDETTARAIRGVQDDGTCWCGGTVWKGRRAMRISVSSWATSEHDVARSLEAILRIASLESPRGRHAAC